MHSSSWFRLLLLLLLLLW